MRRRHTHTLCWLGLGAVGLCLTACPKKDDSGGGGTTTPPPSARQVERTPPGDAAPAPAPARRAGPLTAMQVVDQAIRAAGGLANLKAKLARMELQTKGIYRGMPYTSTVYVKAPDQNVMVIQPLGMEWGVTATDCWRRVRGVVTDCAATVKTELQRMNTVVGFTSLYTLKEPGVTLARTTLRSDAGLRNHIIRATKGALQAILFIDRKSLRLTFATWHGRWGRSLTTGELALSFERFKNQDGVTYPVSSKLHFRGKVVMQEEILSIKLGRVDEAKLSRPAQLAFGVPQLQQAPAHHAAWSRVSANTAQLEPSIMAGVKALYGWAMKNGLEVLQPMPTVHFLRVTRRRATVEIRFPVMKPAKAPPRAKAMGVKAIKAQKIMWALHQGPFTQAQKWLGALRTKLRKLRKRPLGRGGLQPITDPRQATDKSTFLSAVFFPVR